MNCKCNFCKTYNKYKWAVVMDCGCGCHTSDGLTGHDGLCCEVPNALKSNNPHKDLKPLDYYKNKMKEFN